MTIETALSELTGATTSLLNAVNLKKAELEQAIVDADMAAEAAAVDVLSDTLAKVNAIAGGQTAGWAFYATIALRDAAPAPASGSNPLAMVYLNNGSASDPANGVYQWSGSAWVLASWYQDGVAAVVQPLVDQSEAAQLRATNSVPFLTWTALNAATGMAAGDRTAVIVSDTGTHTDPVVGGVVPNAGIYQYSTTPAGWQRVADLDSIAAVSAAAEIQALSDSITLQVFEIIVQNSVVVDEGLYLARLALPFDVNCDRLQAQVLTGTGTVDVSIWNSTIRILDAVEVSPALVDTVVNVTISEGQSVFVGLENIVGDVKSVTITLRGNIV